MDYEPSLSSASSLYSDSISCPMGSPASTAVWSGLTPRASAKSFSCSSLATLFLTSAGNFLLRHPIHGLWALLLHDLGCIDLAGFRKLGLVAPVESIGAGGAASTAVRWELCAADSCLGSARCWRRRDRAIPEITCLHPCPKDLQKIRTEKD